MPAACDHVVLTTDNVSSLIGRRKKKYALFRIESVSRYIYFSDVFFLHLEVNYHYTSLNNY